MVKHYSQRRGLGRGMGCGYRNIVPLDRHIHQMSAKGQKSYGTCPPHEHHHIVMYAKKAKFIPTKAQKIELDNALERAGVKPAEPGCDCKECTIARNIEYEIMSKYRKLNALGKTWDEVVHHIGKHETRTHGVANTLRSDEILTILATMEFFGASPQLLAQTRSDLTFARYRVFDWLGMMIQNEGYGAIGNGETATKVLVHAYLKSKGDIDKFIADLRESDYDVDHSWEKVKLDAKKLSLNQLNHLYDRRISMSEYHQADAQKIKSALSHLIGKNITLYGGGNFFNEPYTGKLSEVTITKPTYYRGDKPYEPEGDIYNVNVKIVGDRLPNGKKEFSPHIGSWRIIGGKK